MKYIWKDIARFQADPEEVGNLLESIAERDGGITPASVVDEARSATSPIHDDFEWDDAIAAEGFRIETAKEMIRFIAIVREDEDEDGPPEPVRAFASVVENSHRHYVPIARVMSEDDLYIQLIEEIQKSIGQYRAKLQQFRHYAELTHHFDGLLAALDEIMK